MTGFHLVSLWPTALRSASEAEPGALWALGASPRGVNPHKSVSGGLESKASAKDKHREAACAVFLPFFRSLRKIQTFQPLCEFNWGGEGVKGATEPGGILG